MVPVSDLNAPADSNDKPGRPASGDGTHPSLRQMDDSEYADDFGDPKYASSPWDLSEDEEAYRAAAYVAVLHYTRDYHLAVLPVWWMKDQQTCACVQGALCDPKSMGKHPCDLRWPEAASDDPEHAARWWRPPEPDQTFTTDWRPRANIGIAMRGKHFITDIDVDAGKQGEESLARLIDEHGGEEMPATLTWQTGGGGRQRVTLAPEGVDVRNSGSEIAPDIDIRGFNGYGIAPPSVSAKGPYIMLTDVSPDAPCPTWEADWLRDKHRRRTEHIAAHPCGDPRQIPADGLTRRSHGYITAAFKDAVGKVATAEEGNRNQSLNDETFDLFSKFVPAGLLSFDDVAAAMQEAGGSCGLPGSAVYKTILSAHDGSQRKDRSSELPDFLFEEPGKEDQDRQGDLKRPDVYPAILTFEQLYDLRKADDGFHARPCDPETPAVVIEIGDDLEYTVMRWWRAQAEAWNDEIYRKKALVTDAWKANLEAQEPEVQLERLRKMVYDDQAREDEGESKSGTDPVPKPDTFSRIMKHLRASATQHEPVELHLRVVDGPGYVAVDLADQSGSVVLITADGWKITDVRSVPDVPWFRRSGTMLPQVHPVAPEDVPATLDSARQVLGLDAGQWAIALCGLIGAYFPSIARPGWWLSGPSGVGKTTRGEQLAGWIDPVATLGGRINLKRDPRDARAKAMNTFVFTIDNASTITQDESDFWCTMHTGASDQVRKLHSDNTLLSYSYRRIGMGTSLTLPSGFQADALRRMLHVKLAGTDDHPDVERIKAEYDKIKPQVMGAIFTVIAEVLRHLPKALEETLVGVPEMSDFARRLKAADLAYPKLVRASAPGGQDLELYEAYRNHAFEVLVAAGLEDPMAILVIRLMDKQERDGKTKLTMLPAGLLKELRILAGPDIAEKWFPPDATRMGEKLTKLDGPLRRLGIVVERTTRTSHGTPYLITRAKKPLESGAGAAGSGAGNGVSTT